MHVHVDKSGRDDRAAGIDRVFAIWAQLWTNFSYDTVSQAKVAEGIERG
jgi:hypothetical protein